MLQSRGGREGYFMVVALISGRSKNEIDFVFQIGDERQPQIRPAKYAIKNFDNPDIKDCKPGSFFKCTITPCGPNQFRVEEMRKTELRYLPVPERIVQNAVGVVKSRGPNPKPPSIARRPPIGPPPGEDRSKNFRSRKPDPPRSRSNEDVWGRAVEPSGDALVDGTQIEDVYNQKRCSRSPEIEEENFPNAKETGDVCLAATPDVREVRLPVRNGTETSPSPKKLNYSDETSPGGTVFLGVDAVAVKCCNDEMLIDFGAPQKAYLTSDDRARFALEGNPPEPRTLESILEFVQEGQKVSADIRVFKDDREPQICGINVEAGRATQEGQEVLPSLVDSVPEPTVTEPVEEEVHEVFHELSIEDVTDEVLAGTTEDTFEVQEVPNTTFDPLASDIDYYEKDQQCPQAEQHLPEVNEEQAMYESAGNFTASVEACTKVNEELTAEPVHKLSVIMEEPEPQTSISLEADVLAVGTEETTARARDHFLQDQTVQTNAFEYLTPEMDLEKKKRLIEITVESTLESLQYLERIKEDVKFDILETRGVMNIILSKFSATQ